MKIAENNIPMMIMREQNFMNPPNQRQEADNRE
jgi:hypothetical protein